MRQLNHQLMDISLWDERYRTGAHAASDFSTEPSPLLVATASKLPPGNALDLASGTGRNALWLAEHGWRVTAIDGSSAAIDILRERAAARHLAINPRITNLEKHEYAIAPSTWDLIAMCYYLQRDLFEHAKNGTIPGGVLIAIVHITEPGEEPTGHRLRPGELAEYFRGWEILHYAEGTPNDPVHKRACAEIVARRPR
jgi:SAM-dependent methyltransferase